MELGFAGKLAQAFIHSPLSPLLFAAMMLLGFYGLMATPRQEDPEISVPMIDVFYRMPGASSEEVAKLLIGPQERVLSEIPGIKHVYSASDQEYGMITLEFDVGEDMNAAIVRAADKIRANEDLIPPGAENAQIKPKEIDDVPVVTLTLWSHEVNDAALRALAVSVQQHLKQLPKTGNTFVVGGRARQVKIDVQPERLAAYGMSMAQMAQVVQGFNAEMTVGSTESAGKYAYVVTGAFLSDADQIKNLVVGNHEGRPIYMHDVADVSIGPEDVKQMVTFSTGAANTGARVDYAQAVTIAIAKQKGANGVDVVNSVLNEMQSIQGYLIPDNVHWEITRNYGKTADKKVNDLLFKLFVATAAVTLLVWYSMGWKPSVVVLLTIPVVLVITVFSAMLMGYSINRVSLFALIFSIGFLVDNAIVIVENIYRRWLMHGEPSTEISIDAVREVGNPTVLATYTVVAALLPMGFVSGMMGPYMEPIPALGSVAMIFSLFAALVFAPWLAMRIVPSMKKLQEMHHKEEKTAEKLDGLYQGTIGRLYRDRKLGNMFLIGLFVAFFLAGLMFYTTGVTVKMLPFDNKAEFQVAIDMPAGTALPDTASFTADIAEIIRQDPDVLSVQTYVGAAIPFDFNGLVRHYYLRQFPWQAQIQVILTDKEDRDRNSHEIANQIRDKIAPLIDASGIKQADGAGVTVVEMPPGPPVLQTLVAEVHGPDAATRKQVARDIAALFNKSEYVGEEQTLMREPMTEWRFDIDTEKAALNGVTIDSINKHLAMAMGEFKVGDLKERGIEEPTYILMQVPLSKRADLGQLRDLPIMNMMQSGTVPLGELGRFVEQKRDDIIFRKDLRPVEFVVGDAKGRLAAPVYAQLDVDELLADYTAPDGVKIAGEYTGAPATDQQSGFEWGGEWTVTFETFRDMGAAYAIALIAIYMLVVWQFGNFIIPAIIMAPIPLTLLGIVPGHMLFGADFTATSMIGWIALAGIIVRNSILLVDFTLVLIRDGLPLYDAVIHAAKARTRPIMITALALVLGSAVILTDPIFQGMAISLLFGVFVSTILTLVVVPLGCLSIGEETFRRVAHVGAVRDNEAKEETEQTKV
ncbi:MAG: efflux RND transporter permease subunit [Chromatiales bacterium]|nr:efflux RND transporter permease subunit [Gammaproteobacteria bacterium]MCP5352331.1 efflux RND transporter permease subunit [Chromatiales bacterium]